MLGIVGVGTVGDAAGILPVHTPSWSALSTHGSQSRAHAEVRPTNRFRHAIAWRMTSLVMAACLASSCEGRRTVSGDAAQLTLTVRVTAPPSLALAAARLGWTSNAVPTAVVVLTRLTSPPTPSDTAQTDERGEVRFRSLVSGAYNITASRSLSDAEIAAAGSAVGDHTVFTSTATAELGEVDEQFAEVRLAPLEQGSLLFSEFSPLAQEDPAKGVYYYYSNYFRIYNNTDTVIALADKLFIPAFPSWRDYSSANPDNNCDIRERLERDPLGVWAQRIYQFPPGARILLPGQAALVVTDAVDHRPIGGGSPGFHDFTGADFEFIGTADVDNPSVPNMHSVGPRNGDVALGHGWMAYDLRAIYLLASPLRLDTLPRQSTPYADGAPFVRIPTAAILDVLSTAFERSSPYPECRPAILPSLDAEEARILPEGGGAMSAHRRVARTLPSGRVILQRSRNSAADWYLAPMTPFRVP